MAAFNKFNQFVEDVAHGVHDLGADQIVVALTNTLPVATDATLSPDISEISYASCSTRNVTRTSSAETSGTYKLTLTDLTLTASGGAVGPFQYVVLYNDTPTSPADPLIGWYDYGSAVTLNDTETLDIDFSDAGGALTIV